MKPRVMSLVIFTCVVGLLIAPIQVDFFTATFSLIAVAIGAGAAGTLNMWYCKNGYPRDLVCECCHQSVAQDALRPEIWRVNLCRNCRFMNNHMPVATVAMGSNTDADGVLTRNQAEMYCCKYVSQHGKRLGQRSVLHEVMDDMARKDESAKAKHGEDFEPSKLGSKLHRAFMAEIGEEVCQAEVAHHAGNLGTAPYSDRLTWKIPN